MKKIFAAFIAFLFFLTSENAIAQEIELGYYIQPQLSSINGSTNSDYDQLHNNQTGTMYTGFFIDYFLTKVLAIETGLSYGHLSQKFLYENAIGTTSTNHYIFQVLKVPLQVQFIKKFGKFAIFAGGGPHLCYLLNAHNHSSDGTYNFTDDYSKLLFGFGFDTGVGFQPTTHLTAFLKPRFEFTSISFHYTSENVHNDYPMGNNLASNCVGLQLGILWSVK